MTRRLALFAVLVFISNVTRPAETVNFWNLTVIEGGNGAHAGTKNPNGTTLSVSCLREWGYGCYPVIYTYVKCTGGQEIDGHFLFGFGAGVDPKYYIKTVVCGGVVSGTSSVYSYLIKPGTEWGDVLDGMYKGQVLTFDIGPNVGKNEVKFPLIGFTKTFSDLNEVLKKQSRQ